jgi:hypothetical protein
MEEATYKRRCPGGKGASGGGGMSIKIEITTGPFLFEFDSYAQWVNKAASWFDVVRSHDCICIDAKGRICTRGLHFITARDEKAFPVKVYYVAELVEG